MGDVSEQVLDRHFQALSSALHFLYMDDHSALDQYLAQRWLTLLKRAPKSNKYARNCLMLLLYIQLHDVGKLSKPFSDIDNIERDLDQLLILYDTKSVFNMPKQETSQLKRNCCQRWASGARNVDKLLSSAVVPETDTEESSVGSSLPFESNGKWLNESDEEVRHGSIQKQVISGDPCQLNFEIWGCINKAIKRLKNWSGIDDHIHFLSTCMEPFINEDPSLRSVLEVFDRKLEVLIETKVQKACEQRENNLMKICNKMLDKQIRLTEEVTEEKNLLYEQQNLERRNMVIWQEYAMAQVPFEFKHLVAMAARLQCGQLMDPQLITQSASLSDVGSAKPVTIQSSEQPVSSFQYEHQTYYNPNFKEASSTTSNQTSLTEADGKLSVLNPADSLMHTSEEEETEEISKSEDAFPYVEKIMNKISEEVRNELLFS